jgi:hypothetical protein
MVCSVVSIVHYTVANLCTNGENGQFASRFWLAYPRTAETRFFVFLANTGNIVSAKVNDHGYSSSWLLDRLRVLVAAIRPSIVAGRSLVRVITSRDCSRWLGLTGGPPCRQRAAHR